MSVPTWAEFKPGSPLVGIDESGRAHRIEQKPTASWYVVKGNNDLYWRVEVPAKAVGAKVCRIPSDDSGKAQLSNPGIGRHREFRWYLTDEGAAYPDHEGPTAVFTRPDGPRLLHAAAMNAQGIRIVAECDDNYLAPKEQNIGMALRYDERSRELHLKAMAGFDVLVFCTEYLRDTYRGALRRELGAKGQELHVVGNHVDPDDWPERLPTSDGRLRVGWMGSDSHLWDLELVYPALKWAADEGCEVVFIGYDPQWRPQAPIRSEAARRGATFGFQYTHIPWVDPATFERPRVAWPLDIGLAPLKRNAFNLAKSDVKFLEMAMSGAATVASNVVYSGSVRHGETGLLAETPEHFKRCVQELVRQPRLRERLASASAQYVREERTIDKYADDWREAVIG